MGITSQNHTSHQQSLNSLNLVWSDFKFCVFHCCQCLPWCVCVCLCLRCHQLSLSATLTPVSIKRIQSCSAVLGWLNLSHSAKSATTCVHTITFVIGLSFLLFLHKCVRRSARSWLIVKMCTWTAADFGIPLHPSIGLPSPVSCAPSFPVNPPSSHTH